MRAKVKVLEAPDQVVVHVVSVKEEVVAAAGGLLLRKAKRGCYSGRARSLKKGKKEEETPAE